MRDEIDHVDWCWSETKADFGRLYNNRLRVLRLAYSRFHGSVEFDAFCSENNDWLYDFALFMALKDKFNGQPWYSWDDKLKFRDEHTMWCVGQELRDEIRFYHFVQFLFYKQWNALHAYAKQNGISIIGDVPIYVPMDSVEVWSNPSIFQLNERLDPVAVAGCPPRCLLR